MADILKKETISEVFVSDAELTAMLGEKAKAAGLVDYDSDEVDVERSSKPDGENGDIQGWKITLKVAS